MQIFTKPVPAVISYPLRRKADPDRTLFFDIETTGLAPSNSAVYLIGAVYRTAEHGWQLTQWFSDSLSSEQEILRAFFAFAANYSLLIHYNGDGFDLPFLKNCASQYHLADPLTEMESLDLYRTVRPYRKLFGTERMNQKSMEKFLGIDRADRFSGAELISVYNAYVSAREQQNLELLLLHNEEDVTGLTALLSLAAYPDFFSGPFRDPEITDHDDDLILRCQSEAVLPHPVSGALAPLAMNACGNRLELTVRKYRGTARHYFEDWKNYYYLPLEKKSVHKSIGEFVDRSARVKATPETACIAAEGTFLPVFGAVDLPVFKTEYRGAVRYVQYDKFHPEDPGVLLSYAADALKYLGIS